MSNDMTIQENEHMFCPRCDSPLEEQAVFCGACGALLRPKIGGVTVFESSDSTSFDSPPVLAPTIFPALRIPARKMEPTVVGPEEEGQVPEEQGQASKEEGQALSGRYGTDEQSANTRDTPALLPLSYPPSSRKKRKPLIWSLVILAIVVVVIGSTFLVLTKAGFKTTSSTPATALVAKGQVSFLDGQDNAAGITDALKITATDLPNLPDGSKYDAWLIDTTNEQVMPLGSLDKSSPTTFALSFPNASSQPQTNLVGAGNKVEVTQEQGNVEAPAGKIMLSATFPPQAFVHIRHLLFKFPTTPGNVGLLPGLINETQKVNALSLMLQNSTTDNAKGSISCIAQAMVNIIEGGQGTNFSPLADNCTRLLGSTTTGDGFGILKYISTASAHAVLAATQPDTTQTIRLHAKDVEASVASMKTTITKIENDVLQLLANPATGTTQVPDIVSLSDRAYHGFDQNGNGKIEPIAGEAGALTAYTNGQLMATLSLS
jgi:hypothetical protein